MYLQKKSTTTFGVYVMPLLQRHCRDGRTMTVENRYDKFKSKRRTMVDRILILSSSDDGRVTIFFLIFFSFFSP